MDEIRQNNSNSDFVDEKKISDVHSNNYIPLEDEHEYINDLPTDSSNKYETNESKFTKRIKRGAGIFLAVGIITMIAYATIGSSSSVNTSADAKAALETHMSTTLTAGTRILAKDETYIGGDLTITHSSNEDETTIYVWDYAAEDGDYVQITVDGTPLGDPFMIKNTPVTFSVPTTGEITVIGTRDGGGGITYGVYYEVNQTTYFNGMNQGGDNTYTLIRE